MKFILFFIIGLMTSFIGAQTIVTGKITDKKGTPIIGVNVYLDGTYDGSTTNNNGEFSFSTSEKGEQILIASFLSYETHTLTKKISLMTGLKIELLEDVNTLDAVVLSAGTFKAAHKSKITVLKPLDVVTTASALGDFVGALQTLPGTTTVAEDGRLFVRGGEAEETQIFIDGIRVFTPYTPTTNNTPTRGRYSPFLFEGITFSTGGYSAEYGQALSSVLLLNTINEPDQEKTDIGIMSVGATFGNTQKWNKSSLSINTSYINLAPYNGLFSDRNNWDKPYEGFSGEVVFRKRYENGLLKLYAAFDASTFELTQEDINFTEGVHYKLKNKNIYFNGSYKGMINDNWSVLTGLSYTYGTNDIDVIDDEISNNENSVHTKLKFQRQFNSRFKLNFGAEYFVTKFEENFANPYVSNINYGFQNNISAAFTEVDIFFSKKIALKAGIRTEYSELFSDFNISPRLSLAGKISKKSQISLAYGNYYQTPTNEILKFEQNLKQQNATHYIFNYQFNGEGRIFRAEAYYKDYDNLVKYNTKLASFDSNYNNKGYGFAQGLDIFWRDSKSIKNIDYWISYSYLDTKREHKNFPIKAQPNFTNTHNLSVVGKYWIEDWKSQIGMSYTFASGRTYTNPNTTGFLNQKTKAYNSLSLNWSYLISQQKIVYFSVNNVLNFQNINGYQYVNTPDINGDFTGRALRPAADRFFFIGFFWTISENGKGNQLNNL